MDRVGADRPGPSRRRARMLRATVHRAGLHFSFTHPWTYPADVESSRWRIASAVAMPLRGVAKGFDKEATRLVETSGRTPRLIAKDLGVGTDAGASDRQARHTVMDGRPSGPGKDVAAA